MYVREKGIRQNGPLLKSRYLLYGMIKIDAAHILSLMIDIIKLKMSLCGVKLICQYYNLCAYHIIIVLGKH
jgi:hypothetical protein